MNRPTAAPPPQPSLLTPGRERALLWLLAFTQFTVIMDFMVMMPLAPQLMGAFTIGPAKVAGGVSAYAWCAGLSGFLAATYIDRFDRKRLLLTVYMLFAVSNLGCALAWNFDAMLVARAFAGFSGGVLSSLTMAVVSDVIPESRRGAATGIVMTSFSLAAIAGVPAGVSLGAYFGWQSPFYLLAGLSAVIWIAALNIVPSLRHHLFGRQPPLREILPRLFALIRNPYHAQAFLLTAIIMTSHMLVIPFISPVLVGNLGILPQQIAWIYMAAGLTTLFTSRRIGRLADRYGKARMFKILAAASIVPILTITHLPHWSLLTLIIFFPIFFVLAGGRFIAMQALLTTVPVPAQRGAFLSVNSAIQSLGTGLGAWLGGMSLSTTATGEITGFGVNGWIATVLVIVCIVQVGRVRSTLSRARGNASENVTGHATDNAPESTPAALRTADVRPGD